MKKKHKIEEVLSVSLLLSFDDYGSIAMLLLVATELVMFIVCA